MAMNWNVKLALWFTVVSTAARGVWAWVTLSLYLKSLTGSTFNVGLSEGIQGFIQALTAVVAGIYADKFRRDVGLRIAGAIGLLAIGATVAALIIPDEVLVGHAIGNSTGSHVSDMARATDIRYAMISTALGLWGMYQGVWNTVMETIFADSIKTGDRSEFNTRKFMLLQAASIVGPIVAVVIFSVTGNTWYHLTLRLVFVVGVLLCVPGALILFFFTDDEALGEESESHAVSRSASRRTDGSGSGASSTPDAGRSRSRDVSGQLDSVASSLAKYESHPTWCGMTASRIPHIIIASDMISGLASGMTIKFFPLYFAKEVYLRPVSVQTIYIALPFFMIVVSKAGQKLSKRLGRVTTSILMSYIGSAALIGLFAVEFYAQWGCYDCPQQHGTTQMQCTNNTRAEDGVPECMWTSDHDSWTCEPIDCVLRDKWYVALGLYFFSTFQHCCRPLKKSILMDYTTKKTRGRWNSLDSVTRFGWSGSAVLGGYLIQNYSYGLTFLVTAFAQIVSATMLFALIPLMGSDHEKTVLSTSGSIQAEDTRRKKELAPLLTNEG